MLAIITLYSKAYKNSYSTLTNKGLAATVLVQSSVVGAAVVVAAVVVVAAAVVVAAGVAAVVLLVLPTTPEDCRGSGTMFGTYTRPLLVYICSNQ